MSSPNRLTSNIKDAFSEYVSVRSKKHHIQINARNKLYRVFNEEKDEDEAENKNLWEVYDEVADEDVVDDENEFDDEGDGFRTIFDYNSLWVRMVKALHGEDGKIGKKIQPRYLSTWLNIINEIESLKLHGVDLVSFITPKLGNGANTLFWDVAWCGDIAFKNLVPKLYAPESMKNIKVASKLSHEGYFEDEMDQRGSHKINVHAWKVIHDCLPTLFNISRRGIEIESIFCPMCECSVESSRHLFFSCKMIRDVMRKITSWWNLEYREINSFEDWCQWISSIRLSVK
nr:RNA-directed DNA polymerase, eukaryota, reverse transcriptase zinc-binding domain protein [Tanacetum cinerariifolium]